MKYAKEVIELMGAHPGTKFRMAQIVRYVDSKATANQRDTIRIGIHRVLRQLESTGHVFSTRDEVRNGSYAEYWWAAPAKTVTSPSCEAYQNA